MSDRTSWKMLHLLYTLKPGISGLTAQQLSQVQFFNPAGLPAGTFSAQILADGAEHDCAQALLRSRYQQYQEMELDPLPVIAIRIERVTSWGSLAAD